MPLTTPAAIVALSLKAAGIFGIGEAGGPEDTNDMFDVLNGMLGQWNRKRWLIYNEVDVSTPVTGAQSYSVGPGQTINVPRVDRLEAAYFRQFVAGPPGQQQVDYPLEILQAHEDYAQVVLKTLTSWPVAIWYDSGYPTGNVYPLPIPTVANSELHLVLKNVIAQFASLTQQIMLPDEYHEALWTNLTIRAAAIYPGAAVTPAVEALAKASLSTIRVANTQIPTLNMPVGIARPARYNIYSGPGAPT